MHPHRELTRLAAHKTVLRRSIARHRYQCVKATARVAQPLAWVDKGLALWRKFAPLAPFAAVPLGLLLKRSAGARPRLLGNVLRWAPLVFKVVRGFTGARAR